MYKSIFLPLLLMFGLFANAQKKNSVSSAFRKYHIPDSTAQTIDGICRYVNNNFQTDSDKVKAYFLWMVINIHYDEVAYNTNNIAYEKQQHKAVFENKIGVCEGYANLFKHFCDKSNIKAYKVTGYSKGRGYHKDSIFNFGKTAHAWNAVKLYDKWYLMDVTWASGSLEYKDTQRVFKYYKADADLFLNSHFPEDPIWQLRYHPLTFSQWLHPKYHYFVPGFKDTIMNYPVLIAEYENSSFIKWELISYKRKTAFHHAYDGIILRVNEDYKNDLYNRAVRTYNKTYHLYKAYYKDIHEQPHYANVPDTTWNRYKAEFIESIHENDSALTYIDQTDTTSNYVQLKDNIRDMNSWFDREIYCIDQYTKHSSAIRKFYSYEDEGYRNHPYTLKHHPLTYVKREPQPPLIQNDSSKEFVSFGLASCFPTFNFRKTDLVFGFGMQLGGRFKNALYSFHIDFFGGVNPDYSIRYKNQVQKANMSSVIQMSASIEKYLYRHKHAEYFISGKLGVSVLNQFIDRNTSDKQKTVDDGSPLIGIGTGGYYRLKFGQSVRFGLEYDFLFHDADGVSNIDGGVFLIRLAYCFGGNKN